MSKKLKFCLCTTFYPPYSADADGWYVHRLAHGLAKLGHEVTVVHNPDAYEAMTGTRVTEPYENHPNITIKKITSPWKRLSLLAVHQTGRPYGQKTMLLECFKETFDVIHYYNISLLGGPEVFSHGKSTIKIGGLNDHWLVCPMHLLWKYTGEVCDKPQCTRCALHFGKPPQLWRHTRLMQNMVRHVDAFLGPSLFTMHKHRERGFSAPMIHLPPLYVIPENAGTIGPALQVRRPFFLCVGRLEDYKGFQNVIPLFRDFQDHSLIICGQGSYGQTLKSLTQGMSNVHFTGPIPQDRIQSLYEQAVATIVPSICHQTFCHITVESYSAGTPVIAYRRSSVEEIISEHGGGILYTQPEELRQAITTMITDGEKRQALRQEASRAFELDYSEAVYLQRYLQVVQELSSQKTRYGKIRDYDSSNMTFADRTILLDSGSS
jgi:glycosyltransferase involved in cell wall biosynthesis